MKTDAIVFPQVNKYEMQQLTLDDLGASDVVVKTLMTAISPGTERWVLRGKHLGTQFPCVPGYHRVGVVEQRGANVKTLEVGDIVYGSSGRWKEQVKCMFGAHVLRSVADEKDYKYIADTAPSQHELEEITFTLLAGVAYRGVQRCQVSSHQKVLIIGAGILGICAAQLIALRGGQPALLEKDKAKCELAKQIVPSVFHLDDENLEEKLNENAPGGYDALYDTVGHAGTTDQMVQRTRPGGTLLLQAQYFDREHCAIDLDQIKVRELTVRTTCGVGDDDWHNTLNLIRQRALQIAPMITHRFNSSKAIEGYKLLDTGNPMSLGITFDWRG